MAKKIKLIPKDRPKPMILKAGVTKSGKRSYGEGGAVK